MSPGDTYGGWLENNETTSENRGALIRLITNELGNVRWLVNPFLTQVMDPSTLPIPTNHTLALDLSGGYSACRARWSKGHKAAGTQARRLGVTVRLAQSIVDWRGYFEVYQDSLRRWGSGATSHYDWSLFLELSGTEDVRLWLAIADDQVIAGALCLYHPSQVAYWHGATLEAAFQLRPSNLLLEAAIQHACELGVSWFDLGPSGGHHGVERFKRGFGPTMLGFSVVDRSSPVVAFVRRLRRASRMHGRSRVGGS